MAPAAAAPKTRKRTRAPRKTPTFRGWLRKQLRRDDELGQLAKRVTTDPQFPDKRQIAPYATYFESAPEAVREVAALAWIDYRRSLNGGSSR